MELDLGTGEVRFVVGSGERGYDGEGPALDARIDCGSHGGCGFAVFAGTMWLADSGNGVLGTIDLDTGIIETWAEELVAPTDVAVGPDGSLHVADPDASCVSRLPPGGTLEPFSGVCGTVAGPRLQR